MKILITGASGFVGSALMRMYGAKPDIEILGIARSQLDREHYLSVDVSRPFTLDFKPDVVVHAAALASPWGKKSDYKQKNFETTRQVIKFCQENNVGKLIYLSSSSVFYQPGHQLNITEDTPIGPNFVNDYAATKYAGEELVRAYEGNTVILRPRAVFGPYDTVLFPRVLHAARKGKLPIFKSDGGAVVGDIIYIDVLCDYIMKAALNSDIVGEYNLTNAAPVEIQSFLFNILQQLDIPLPTRTVSVGFAMKIAGITEFLYRLFRLKGEPPVTKFGVEVFGNSKTFDVSKMLRDLGDPICQVDEGVENFIRWQRDNG